MGLLSKLFDSDDLSDEDLRAVGELVDDMTWDQRNQMDQNAVNPKRVTQN